MNRLQAMSMYKDQLIEFGIPEEEASAEVRLALSAVLGIDTNKLYISGQQLMTDTQLYRMGEVIKRRKTGEPLAYILGERWFMGIKFSVSPAVLIPRRETEHLAEAAIQYIRQEALRTALDICTGSGCVAISLAKYTRARISALDISEEALEIARKNAKINFADVKFIKSDLFSEVTETFDVITANPPYIKSAVIETLERQVKDFEPRLALDGGIDGLDFYKKIIRDAFHLINPGGALIMEIDPSQKADVEALAKEAGFNEVRTQRDLSGNYRVVKAIKEKPVKPIRGKRV